jgi:26S proteasome regulatory subunit N2
MNAGTTRDSFLRENLEWLSRATNWAKFSATAGLGVIHKGHIKEGKKILGDYLPNKSSSSPFSEGGALYALGLIFANHGEEVTGYMTECLREFPQVIQIQHGACLGLGIAGVATGNDGNYFHC